MGCIHDIPMNEIMASFDVSWHYNRYFITQVAGSVYQLSHARIFSVPSCQNVFSLFPYFL